jgi:hypothetical protein
LRTSAIVLLVGSCLLASEQTLGQELSLPPGAQTTWVVEGAEEIIAYFAFDTEAVAERLPDDLVFLTMAEISSADNETARAHLAAHPDQAAWGVSFLEIVRQEVFEIDGRSPNLSDQDAFALWFAAVQPSDGSSLSRGRLVLDLWMPDSAYAEYMREIGHYASHGVVRLSLSADGTWIGHIEADGLPWGRAEAWSIPRPTLK